MIKSFLALSRPRKLVLLISSQPNARSFIVSSLFHATVALMDTQKATFGGGCFWCTEACFQTLKGVDKVVSGYEGGHKANPSYKEVCGGDSGHAECVHVTYKPDEVSYVELLKAFFTAHDPTTLNYQGNDHGTQYRSVIFYHSPEQKAQAEEIIRELNESGVFKRSIVTEVTPTSTFYKAEGYHQNYYNDNPSQGYCQAVVHPKLEKFKKVFADKLKKK